MGILGVVVGVLVLILALVLALVLLFLTPAILGRLLDERGGLYLLGLRSRAAVDTAAQNGGRYLRGDDRVDVIVRLGLLLAAAVGGQTCGHAAEEALLNVDGGEVAGGGGGGGWWVGSFGGQVTGWVCVFEWVFCF